MNANHTNCHHVNTGPANALCDSFKTPVVVAFNGSKVREAMHANRVNNLVKARMDRAGDEN